MDLFDILGPVMVGPSSSHTAGAVRIGYVSRLLLGAQPDVAQILLHGSFAATGIGHGTDRALVAGLLGMQPDDIRIPQSFELAQREGLQFSIGTVELRDAHPNTVLLRISRIGERPLEVTAASLGGGRIRVTALDGIETNFTGERPTLIIRNLDRPGRVAQVTAALFELQINIATMKLYRDTRGGYAVMVLELDQPIDEASLRRFERMEGVLQVTYLDPITQC